MSQAHVTDQESEALGIRRPRRRRMSAAHVLLLAVGVGALLWGGTFLLDGETKLAAEGPPGVSSYPMSYPPYSYHWRIGFGCAREEGYVDEYDIDSLCAGWYHDWGTMLEPPRPGGIEYVQLIRVGARYFDPDNPEAYAWEDLYRKIDANPGAVWQIGNEPDGSPIEPSCDGLDPATYARIYKIFYERIKARDATAQLTNGPIIQGSPLRMAWLTMVWDAYAAQNGGQPMPVDIWNMHNQVIWEKETGGAYIPEGCEQYPAGCAEFNALALPQYVQWPYGLTLQDVDNPEVFRTFVENMRRWMKDHGQQDKPLIISEFGMMQPEHEGFTVDRVNQFMDATFLYLMYAKDPQLGMPADDYRLVQRWNWFSLNAPLGILGVGGWNGNLFDPDSHQITEFGRNFAKLACNENQPTPTPNTTPRPSWVKREAEGGSLHGFMAIGQSEEASDCRYIHIPAAAAASRDGQSATLTQNTDSSYHVYAPSTGNYIIWVRGWGFDWNNYAYGVRVNDYPEAVVRFSGFGNWEWKKVPQTYYLQGGRWHEIVLGPRGGGQARVDLFVFTADLNYDPRSDPALIAPCNPTPTATPTETLTPTLTLTPTPTRTPMPWGPAGVSGEVDFQARGNPPSPSWAAPLLVSVHLPGDPIPAYLFEVASNVYGQFSVPSGVLPGTYDVGVRNMHSLRNLRQGVALGGTTPYLDMDLLVEGDANLDNSVDISDLAILARVYGGQIGDPYYDNRVDFNEDGQIDVSDLALIAKNYGLQGDRILSK